MEKTINVLFEWFYDSVSAEPGVFVCDNIEWFFEAYCIGWDACSLAEVPF